MPPLYNDRRVVQTRYIRRFGGWGQAAVRLVVSQFEVEGALRRRVAR